MAKRKKNRVALSGSMPKPRLPVPVAPSQGGAKGKRKKKKATSRHIHPYAAIMLDPRTAKLDYAHPPDQNPRPTVVFRSTQNFTAQTDSNGCLWTELRALPAGFRTPLTMATTAGTISALGTISVHADNTALAAAFSAVRPMVMAVEVEYVGELQLAKGTLSLCVSDVPAAVGWTQDQMTDEPYYKETSVSTLGSVAAVARYAPADFYDISATALGTGHPRVFVMASGMPTASTCIRVRTTFIGEYLCLANSILQTQARYSPSLPLVFASAQSLNSPEAVIAEGTNAWEKLKKGASMMYDVVRFLNGLNDQQYDPARLNIEL